MRRLQLTISRGVQLHPRSHGPAVVAHAPTGCAHRGPHAAVRLGIQSCRPCRRGHRTRRVVACHCRLLESSVSIGLKYLYTWVIYIEQRGCTLENWIFTVPCIPSNLLLTTTDYQPILTPSQPRPARSCHRQSCPGCRRWQRHRPPTRAGTARRHRCS